MADMCYYGKNRYKTYLKYIYFWRAKMVNYQKLYTMLFNAATDALEALEELNVGRAKDILRQAQIDAEETYLEEPET